MRSFAPAALACVAVAAVTGGRPVTAAALEGGAPPAPAASAAAGNASAANAPPGSAPIDNEAPARHARRTACLHEAKSKRLAGARRTAYVKGCMAAS